MGASARIVVVRGARPRIKQEKSGYEGPRRARKKTRTLMGEEGLGGAVPTLSEEMRPPCEVPVPYAGRRGREELSYRRHAGGAVGVVLRVRPVRRALGTRRMRPLVSTAIKEALEETRDAVATCPFASRPSLTTTPSRLFVTISSSRVRAVPRMLLR